MTTMLTIRPVCAADMDAISALHKSAFGPGRYARTAYRVREGNALFSPHCRAAFLGDELVAALRFTPVTIGGKEGTLLLGPVAVDPDKKGSGYGRAVISRAIEDARSAGFHLVVLVGDMPYYGRFGFTPVPQGQITFPGPVNPMRILALELSEGALAGYRGNLAAT
ncbi:MAG: N-acetyltransferase [Hyphomicrobiaceae bacterium]|nr:N-acetyltransferase [Hyphomicrobiaceae bacterium]